MLATAAAACLELRLGLKSSCSWLLSQPWAFQAGTCMVAAGVAAWSSQLQQLQLLGAVVLLRARRKCRSLAGVTGCHGAAQPALAA